jgi:hypothetical protein
VETVAALVFVALPLSPVDCGGVQVSAAVIPFPSPSPRFEASAEALRQEQEAIRQARLIKHGQDSGASMALALAMLAVMPRGARVRVQSELEAAPDNDATEEALALVRYANASNAEKRLVAIMLGRMGGRPF